MTPMPFPAKAAATERQDIAATVERLTAVIFLLSGRVAEVEESNREMRAEPLSHKPLGALAATAQNLRKLAKLVPVPGPVFAT